MAIQATHSKPSQQCAQVGVLFFFSILLVLVLVLVLVPVSSFPITAGGWG